MVEPTDDPVEKQRRLLLVKKCIDEYDPEVIEQLMELGR